MAKSSNAQQWGQEAVIDTLQRTRSAVTLAVTSAKVRSYSVALIVGRFLE
jgi:hypothetical protein